MNRLIDAWDIKRGMIYSLRNDQYPMDPPKLMYTIGRGPGADFVADRPGRIEAANIVLATGGAVVYTPLRILDSLDWATTRLRDFPTTFPTAMYFDNNYPNADLWMWGTPTQNNILELWTWQQASQFVTSEDTVLVPPGYLEAMVYNLAVRMGDQFGTTAAMSPNVFTTARKSLADIKGINQPSPAIASADIGIAKGPAGDFNFYTGGPN